MAERIVERDGKRYRVIRVNRGNARCKTCKQLFPISALTHGNGTFLGECFECECDRIDREKKEDE